MVSHPPNPRPRHASGLVHSVDPDKKHANMLPNATHHDPPTHPLLKISWGRLSSTRSSRTAKSFFLGGGLEGQLGLAVEDLRDNVFYPPPTPGTSRPPRVHPPPHLCHPLRHPPPTRAGSWQEGAPLAGALPAAGCEGRADRRRCRGALSSDWVPITGTVCECPQAAERLTAVHELQAGDERGMGNSMSMRM